MPALRNSEEVGTERMRFCTDPRRLCSRGAVAPPGIGAGPRGGEIGTCALPADKAGSQGRGSAPRSRVRFRGVASSSLAPVRHGVTGAQRRSAGGLHRKITLHEHPSTPARDIAWSHRRTDRDRRRHHHRPCPETRSRTAGMSRLSPARPRGITSRRTRSTGRAGR